MRFSSTAIVSAALTAMSVSAATFNITVGKDASLLYEPSSVTIAAGDTLSFQFLSKNHTVTQSTFADPCTAKAGGVDSGYLSVLANATTFPTWSIQITNVTAPLWFFCEQTGHCQKGMVFAVNPTADKTFDMFKATAMGAAAGTGTPAGTGTTGGTAANGTSTDAATPSATNGAGSSRFSSASAIALSLGSLALGSLLL
jgi:hypothetical protein